MKRIVLGTTRDDGDLVAELCLAQSSDANQGRHVQAALGLLSYTMLREIPGEPSHRGERQQMSVHYLLKDDKREGGGCRSVRSTLSTWCRHASWPSGWMDWLSRFTGRERWTDLECQVPHARVAIRPTGNGQATSAIWGGHRFRQQQRQRSSDPGSWRALGLEPAVHLRSHVLYGQVPRCQAQHSSVGGALCKDACRSEAQQPLIAAVHHDKESRLAPGIGKGLRKPARCTKMRGSV
jgi:hypothetical protein